MDNNINKKDFVELEFTGKAKDGDIFDTNVQSEAKKINLNIETKPLVICVGEKMVVKGFDDFINGKEIGKEYSVELKPSEAFGERNPSLVRILPMSAFRQQNVAPRPGMVFALDNMLVRIISVSGGRVFADFNNPLAGKFIIYDFKIKRKIEDINEKINALMNFFYKKELPFEVKENKIIITVSDKGEGNFVRVFSKKFKEILNLDVESKTEENK
jgi:FKBP-type peptidyl-prolyl cis-trans isomerase 2